MKNFEQSLLRLMQQDKQKEHGQAAFPLNRSHSFLRVEANEVNKNEWEVMEARDPFVEKKKIPYATAH